MIVIQIRRVEIKEEYLILVNSKKGEGRKKDFISQNQKYKRRKNNIISEPFLRFSGVIMVGSRTAAYPSGQVIRYRKRKEIIGCYNSGVYQSTGGG